MRWLLVVWGPRFGCALRPRARLRQPHLQRRRPPAPLLPTRQVNADGVFRYQSSRWFSAALQRLAATGIRGVAVDVWVSALGGAGLEGEPGCCVVLW